MNQECIEVFILPEDKQNANVSKKLLQRHAASHRLVGLDKICPQSLEVMFTFDRIKIYSILI
jgi:hypothetical protein